MRVENSMKKYIAITVFALAVALLSVFARNFNISDSVTNTENNICGIDTTMIEAIKGGTL